MKILKTASGKQTVKISKKEWTDIGIKAGWMKESAGWGTKFPDMTEDDWKKLDKSHEEKFQQFEDEKAEERRLILEDRRKEKEDYKKREDLRRKRRSKNRLAQSDMDTMSGENDDDVKKRRYIKVDFDDGDSLETWINGTKKGVENYYLNNSFTKNDEVSSHKGVNVDFLK